MNKNNLLLIKTIFCSCKMKSVQLEFLSDVSTYQVKGENHFINIIYCMYLPYFSEPPQQKAFQVFWHSVLCQTVKHAEVLGEGY